MRDRIRRARARVRRFLDESAWLPLFVRGAGFVVGLLLLAIVGMGAFDRTLDLGPPRAEAAAARTARTRDQPPRAPRETTSLAAASPAAVSPAAASPAQSSSAPGSSSAGAQHDGPHTPPAASAKVVLNTATATELERLPGVGPSKAAAIVALRTKLGGKFKRFEDLLRVRGIKRRSLERIREHAVLDAPSPEPVDPAPDASSSAPRAVAQPAPSASSPW